jgi:hypothetical protein
MIHSQTFRLKVQRIGQVCLFELSWGQGQQRSATLNYPETLTRLYQDWQRSYLNFYQTLMPTSLRTDVASGLRGWQMAGGSASAIAQPPPGSAHSQTSSQTNWHARLIEAQARLMYEFHHWLRSAELYEIRAEMARASREWGTVHATGLDIFLTCDPIELARFPWESWEISNEFAAIATVRIVRVPINVSQPPNQVSSPSKKQRSRARILAVMGDETGLSFQLDRMAVQSLYRLAEIRFVGWQPGRDVETVKREIVQAIADERGWDVLFFAGHSNETELSGGELGIAPGVSIAVSEIAPQLAIARDRGLQFALFNSCSGLNIAETLIGLGLSQVAVMREPVHNRVAQEFLVTFLKGLEQFKDVHEALLEACQVMKLEKNLTFPSAWLVPSLFCHPGAAWFRLKPFGWRQRLGKMMPSRLEAIALTAFCIVGLIPESQNFAQKYLLNQRIKMQAVYRNETQQVPPIGSPPVLLVQINPESIDRDNRILNPYPISQSYLSDLVKRLSNMNAKMISFDYKLDEPDGNERLLSGAIQSAVKQNQTWFAFASRYPFEQDKIFTAHEGRVAEKSWSLQGYTESLSDRMMLPDSSGDCRQACPFAYLQALLHTINQTNSRQDPLKELPSSLLPNLNSREDLRTNLINFVDKEASNDDELARLQALRLFPITELAYNSPLEQPWLQPIIDFSIPPDRIYARLSAWRVLEDPTLSLPKLDQQIVMIASGAYEEAGDETGRRDYQSVPSAVEYWRLKLPQMNNAALFPNGRWKNRSYLDKYTGGEVIAYTIHHLLTNRLVIPIPDLWLVGIAGLFGKGIVLMVKRQKTRHQWSRSHQILAGTVFLVATAGYGLAGLQLYISAAILLPWVLPSSMFWLTILPIFRRNTNAF